MGRLTQTLDTFDKLSVNTFDKLSVNTFDKLSVNTFDKLSVNRFSVVPHLSRRVDWIDVMILGCICAFGLFILASISQPLFIQQFFYLILGVILALLVSAFDAALIVWLAPFGYIAALVLLGLSYFGPSIRGATRWIVIGGLQLQPSELVKPLLLLAFSWALAKFPPKSIRNVVFHFGLFLPAFLLVFKQPDLGTSLVYAVFWLAMIMAGGFPLRLLVGLTLVGFLVIPLGWKSLQDYQQARILTFINPTLDPKGAGYNAIQATIAVGSGQLLGRGLGRGTQSHLRFLPEYHTDFIFATLVEEFGLVGGVALLLGYAVLLWRIIMPLIKGAVSQIFPFVYSVGLLMMLLAQVFINTGMNMGIIPITGITLPFVSYGGSSLLSVAVLFGLLWSLRRWESQKRDLAIDR